MTQQSDASEAQPLPPALKIVEPDVDPDEPWRDDVLGRKEIADRLTSIIRGQEAPFVISLDGRWGTGKTFLLKRWRQALQNDGFQAIYFNAWEDDFCDDPLLAVIGQLSEHFKAGMLGVIARGLGNIALPILTSRLTGVPFKARDLKPENLLSDYQKQRETKDKVSERLAQLAAEVRETTGQPLVFIIDELDRCRPTFAIELLERVKHIFDVPNIVFVFGINRAELVKSLESVYGEIDASVYLRRFFDMEFILPDADSANFCGFLVSAYGLDSFFNDMSRNSNSNIHASDFRSLSDTLPVILGRMGLSLRDMDYCVRLVALAAKGLKERHTVFPAVLALLVAVKITKPDLYQRFVLGMARGAEIIDYVNQRHQRYGGGEADPNRRDLEWVEAGIYFADNGRTTWAQLGLLREGKQLTRPELLAEATRRMSVDEESNKRRLDNLIEGMQWFSQQEVDYQGSVGYLAELIDVYNRDLLR